MVTKQSIYKNLNDLNKLYNNSIDPMQKLYYSKLAILELCGWIEEKMDELILMNAKKKLRVTTRYNTNNYNYLYKNIVKKNHGFIMNIILEKW